MAFLEPPLGNRRFIYALAVMVSLFLVFLGIKVPNISKPQGPKPRHKAVLEAPVKPAQEPGTKVHADLETCSLAPVLDIPTCFQSSLQQNCRAIDPAALEHRSSRAPPAIPALIAIHRDIQGIASPLC